MPSRRQRLKQNRLTDPSLIGVGFSGKKVPLNRLPGWEAESWAYHGDDGFSFCQTAQGKEYGAKFQASDTVGCGIDFRTREAFFTKNGVHQGKQTPLSDVCNVC